MEFILPVAHGLSRPLYSPSLEPGEYHSDLQSLGCCLMLTGLCPHPAKCCLSIIWRLPGGEEDLGFMGRKRSVFDSASDRLVRQGPAICLYKYVQVPTVSADVDATGPGQTGLRGSRDLQVSFHDPSNGMPWLSLLWIWATLLATTSAVLAAFVDLYLSSRLCGVQQKGGHTQRPLVSALLQRRKQRGLDNSSGIGVHFPVPLRRQLYV